jgi:hypothetical protein
MAPALNLSVPNSQDNPAPTFSKPHRLSREWMPRRIESRAARPVSLSRFTAGALLGFSGAYVLHSPLTVGQITILAAFGILLLANGIIRRRVA